VGSEMCIRDSIHTAIVEARDAGGGGGPARNLARNALNAVANRFVGGDADNDADVAAADAADAAAADADAVVGVGDVLRAMAATLRAAAASLRSHVVPMV
jgi:hypothetical protein